MVSVTGTHRRWILAVGVAAVGGLCLVQAGAGLAAEPPPTNPKPLWDAYPLAPQVPPPPAAAAPPRPKPATPAPPPPAPPPPATPSPTPAAGQSRERRTGPMLFVAGGLGALALLGAAALLISRTRRRRSRLERWRSTVPALTGRETPGELVAVARALAKEAAECDTYVYRQRKRGIGDMSQTADHDPAPTSGKPASTYADIGDRVAGVLSAAEAAAEEIRDEARTNAEEIVAAAKREADELRRETAAYDADTRAAVESYATERRREAEQAVQKHLTDGQAQARATRQAAEAMARQIEEEGQSAGPGAAGRVEGGRGAPSKTALAGLRRMTVELEDLVGDSRPRRVALRRAQPPGKAGAPTSRRSPPSPPTSPSRHSPTRRTPAAPRRRSAGQAASSGRR